MQAKDIANYRSKLHKVIPGFEYKNSDFYKDHCKKQIYFSKLSLDGLQDMHEYSVLPEFYDYMEMPPHKTLEDTRQYFDNLNHRIKLGYQGGDAMYWFLKQIETNKVIGTMGLLKIDFKKKKADIGYGISPYYWGSGFIFEGLWLLLKYCFEVLNLNRIGGTAEKDNQRSISVLKAVGFKIEGCLREYAVKFDGTKHDVIIVGLLKKDVKLERCLSFAKIVSNNWK